MNISRKNLVYYSKDTHAVEKTKHNDLRKLTIAGKHFLSEGQNKSMQEHAVQCGNG